MPMTTAQFPDLKDAGVLITGGGSGIGASLVEAFAMQGAKVAFIDIAEEPSEALVRRLSGVSPHPVHFFRADLRDVAAIAVTVTEAAAAIGGIKVLVNNAAWDDRHDIDTVTEAYWDANQAVNLVSAQHGRTSLLCGGEGRHHRVDKKPCRPAGARKYPRQHAAAGHVRDRAAEGTVADG